MGLSMSWNDERVELLKKLWADGLSASQMAGRIGGVTRNAIIGKVHRLGLSGRATTSRLKTHRPKKTRLQRRIDAIKSRVATKTISPAEASEKIRQMVRVPVFKPDPLPTSDLPPVVARLKFADLEPHHCRMPVGDPQHEDFGFCAEPVALGKPYCPSCCQRAYAPPKTPVRPPYEAKPNTAPASLKRLLQTA